MKILITGSRGLVGSHFAKKLEEHYLTLIDIKDGNDAGQFFRENNEQYDLVIHAAATVGGRKVIDLEPHRLFNNFALDAELFQWSLKTGPKKIVYFSSSAAYPMLYQGKNSGVKLKESDIDLDDVLNPDPSIYGWSKLTGEHLAYYARKQGLPVYVFRPFSGYSEHQDLDYPFPSFIKRALDRNNPFDIWGTGEQVRDWVHMDDVVNAVLATLDHEPMTLNICTGKPTSFNQFASMVCDAVNYSPSFNRITDAPMGVWYRVGDPTELHKVYVPKITIREGINRALHSVI